MPGERKSVEPMAAQLAPNDVRRKHQSLHQFHPLRSHSLPVIRQYNFHDEFHYLVRLADGRPLAVPAWMTRPEAANTRIVSTACLPVRVLL